jgi:hypothetical protein
MKTNYDILKELKSQGQLKPLMQIFGLPTHYIKWMECYEFHLQNPGMSYGELSYHLPATRSTIHRAITFLEMPYDEDL